MKKRNPLVVAIVLLLKMLPGEHPEHPGVEEKKEKKVKKEEPKPRPELKDILGDIDSAFVVDEDIVELYIHVDTEAYANEIYGIEILPEVQEPPWKSAEGLKGPEGWDFEKMDKGVRFYTETMPLIKCQQKTFSFKVHATEIPKTVKLHATDKVRENLGMIISFIQ